MIVAASLASLSGTASASEGAPPLIDIDGTSLLIFAMFIVMMAVLNRFLFQPYLKMRDQREHRIGGARKEATDAEARVTAMMADYEAQLARTRQRGSEERARLRTEGASTESDLLGKARAESQSYLDATRKTLDADARKARDKLQAEAATLARAVVHKVLGREVRS